MIFNGVMLQAHRLALQYGDCLALAEFWRDSLHTYHILNKVLEQ